MNKIIFIDMDGVLADLDTGLSEHTGQDLRIESLERTPLFKKYLPEFTEANGFASQPAMKKAQHLMEHLLQTSKDYKIKLAILTSHGDFYDPSEVVRQKKVFLAKHFPKLNIPFCATSSGGQKADLAHPGAFLIDDHHKNIEKFIAAGGDGTIYHEDRYFSAMNDIEKFIRKQH